MKEKTIASMPGIPTAIGLFAVLLASVWSFIQFGAAINMLGVLLSVLVGGLCLLCVAGFYMVEPNQAAVLSLFGKYMGTVKDQVALRSHAVEISHDLAVQLAERLAEAGVAVQDARISHLAYSPEIAGAMLQRQQAGAIIAARELLVEGAVGMVEMALDKPQANGVVDLDNERRAQMISNLLVVLCSDRATQPVVNTGCSVLICCLHTPARAALNE